MKLKSKSILYYRKHCKTDDCVKKYYKDLDYYLDISENPMNFRKKEFSLDKVQNDSYSIGYFKNGQLVRFNYNGQILAQETYLVWKDNLVREAHTFLLYYRNYSKMRKLFIPKLYTSYAYTYDDKKRLKDYYCKNYKDKHYYIQTELLIWQGYEYDGEGLKIICRTLEGPDWRDEPFIIYDREKERFIKQFTVSKTAMINRHARNNDGLVEFNNSDKYKTKTCPHCGHNLSYILTVNLNDRKSINTALSLKKMPVLFCFKCLNEQAYSLDELNHSLETQSFLSDATYKFVGTTDEEKLEESFLSVGGKPRWVQNDEHPNCPICGKPMVFIMEIKSREELTNGEDYLMFGDCGSLFVFSCCEKVFVTMQCT